MGMEFSDKNIAAETRAVEEGHHALLAHDRTGIYVKVISDTTPGRHYKIRATAPNGPDHPVMFTCAPSDWDPTSDAPHPHNTHGLLSSTNGIAPCKHAALAARRLERSGLIRFVQPHVTSGIAHGSKWVATKAATHPARDHAIPQPADPFAGFPKEAKF